MSLIEMFLLKENESKKKQRLHSGSICACQLVLLNFMCFIIIFYTVVIEKKKGVVFFFDIFL